jgi:hypothetical protein
MTPPAILRCFTAADVQAYLRIVAAAPSANFTPTNIVNTMITPDRAIDVVGSNHLDRQAGSSARVKITEFGTDFPLWGLSVKQGNYQGAWVCPTIGAWSYNGSQAFLSVERLDVEGIGGTYVGCLKGPNRNQPVGSGGNGTTYGSDRGWTKSSNGGGKKGFAFYGDEGGGDQDARLFRPNSDFAFGTTSLVGAGFRVEIIGWDPNYGGAGVGAGYHWSATANQRIWEYYNCVGTPEDPVDDPEGSDLTGGAGTIGDASSPDGRMSFGAIEYLMNATTTPYIQNLFEGVMACGYWFTGAAADAIHTYKTTICTTVQTSIDAAVV